MKRDIPSTSDQIIDSRDVIARIDDLTSERESLESDVGSARTAMEEAQQALDDAPDGAEVTTLEEKAQSAAMAHGEAIDNLAKWDQSSEADELKALKALADEAEGYSSDWIYGATLIREDYFPDYCQELVEDIGDLPKDLPSYIAIDWDQTADNLRADYTEVDFDGTTYFVR